MKSYQQCCLSKNFLLYRCMENCPFLVEYMVYNHMQIVKLSKHRLLFTDHQICKQNKMFYIKHIPFDSTNI